MHIHKVTKDGDVKPLANWDVEFNILQDDDDYFIALTIGDEEEGIVITLDSKEYDSFKRSLALTKTELVRIIRNNIKLNRALDKEFKE